MQQDLGRMMADLIVAEDKEVDANGSPKKKDLKIIKKRVWCDLLSTLRFVLRVCVCVCLSVQLLDLYARGSGFSAGFGLPGRRSVSKVRGIVSRTESTHVEVRLGGRAHTHIQTTYYAVKGSKDPLCYRGSQRLVMLGCHVGLSAVSSAVSTWRYCLIQEAVHPLLV